MNSFYYASINLKRAFCVEWPFEMRIVARSDKYTADQTLIS